MLASTIFAIPTSLVPRLNRLNLPAICAGMMVSQLGRRSAPKASVVTPAVTLTAKVIAVAARDVASDFLTIGPRLGAAIEASISTTTMITTITMATTTKAMGTRMAVQRDARAKIPRLGRAAPTRALG